MKLDNNAMLHIDFNTVRSFFCISVYVVYSFLFKDCSNRCEIFRYQTTEAFSVGYKARENNFPPIQIVLGQYSKQLITRESKAPLLYQQNPMGRKLFYVCSCSEPKEMASVSCVPYTLMWCAPAAHTADFLCTIYQKKSVSPHQVMVINVKNKMTAD